MKKKKQIKKDRIEAFMNEYKQLANKHRLDIAPRIQVLTTGISPILTIIDLDELAKQQADNKGPAKT